MVNPSEIHANFFLMRIHIFHLKEMLKPKIRIMYSEKIVRNMICMETTHNTSRRESNGKIAKSDKKPC